MNKEVPYREHAEKIKQKIEKLTEPVVDESNLPPRGQIHRSKRRKKKNKVNLPLIRILVLFFILLPVVIFSIYTNSGPLHFFTKKVSVATDKGYETINFKTTDKGQNNRETKQTANKKEKKQNTGSENNSKNN